MSKFSVSWAVELAESFKVWVVKMCICIAIIAEKNIQITKQRLGFRNKRVWTSWKRYIKIILMVFFSKKIFFWSPFNPKMACHYDSGLADLSIFLDFVQSKRPGGTSKLYKWFFWKNLIQVSWASLGLKMMRCHNSETALLSF